MLPPLKFKFKHEPMQHQRKVLEDSIDEAGWAFFLEMGTGKSKIAIDTLAHWFTQGRIDRALLVAKKGEYANFYYDQIPEHWPTELPIETLLYSSYLVHTADFRRDLRRFLALPPTTFKVLVANVESLRGEKLEDLLDDFFYRQRVGLVVDESTCVKSHTSSQTKTLLKYAPRAKLRRIMTGTAVTESPLDLWGQTLVLGKGLLGHSSFSSFRGEYTNVVPTVLPTGATVNKYVGYRNEDKLKRVIKTFSSQVLKSECLDLPEKVYVKKVVELDPDHRKKYDQLRREAMLEVEGHEIEVLHAMSLSSKMHQLAAGQVKDEEGNYHWVESAKMQATVDILSDYEGKAIIWCPYKAPLLRLVDRLNKEFGHGSAVGYFGGVADEDRKANLAAFKDPGSETRFFVANQSSAGFGITMLIAKMMIYYANSYKLELRLQSEDRSHRIGQTDNVTYVDLVARGTVDEACYQALRDKKKMSDVIMSRPPSAWL